MWHATVTETGPRSTEEACESTMWIPQPTPRPPAHPGEPGHLRSMVSVSVMLRTLCRRLSSLCGSSFRNRTASTSMRRMARILFCRVGNSPAGQEQWVSRRRGSQDSEAPPRTRDWTGLCAWGSPAAVPLTHLQATDVCQTETDSMRPRARTELLMTSLPVCIFGIRSPVPSGCL